MWWPRPRWKNDFFKHFILLIFFTTLITTNVVMADEGQHCDSNMSTVVWTTALCTVLLVFIVIAIYRLYCQRRQHGWSSLWRKNTLDKNLVLQTLPPVKDQHLKSGGTDNPAFSADTNVGDRATGTRIVRVPSSTIDEGSLGVELSIKEDGSKIYMCKHNDGSKDCLVAMRLVFDKGLQKRQRDQPSDLSRILAELSRTHGFDVELETEAEIVAVAPPPPPPTVENGDGSEEKCEKSNLLSVFRGKALRLWNQRPAVFKSGSGNVFAEATKENDCDVESGLVGAAAGGAAPDPKTSCSVTVVDETAQAAPQPAQQPKPYRTLEYGATFADAAAYSSPEDNVQCCTVNAPGPVVSLTAATADAVSSSAEADKHSVAVARETRIGGEVVDNKGTVADDKRSEQTKRDEPKQVQATNPPPPPPPRKYSASVVSSAAVPSPEPVSRAAAATAAEAVGATTTVAANASPPSSTVIITATSEATPERTPRVPKTEIRVDDDYYWCTTTVMASPMSTFGKRPVDCGSDDSGVACNGTVEKRTSDGEVPTAAPAADDKSAVVATGGGTTSIEDASLPSFSSDEDEDDDDNGVFAAEKNTKHACPVAETDGGANASGAGGEVDGEVRVDGRKDEDRAAAKVVRGDESPRNDDGAAEAVSSASAAETKSPSTKLPTLRQSLSSPPQSSTAAAAAANSYRSSSASSTSSTSSSSSSPTNNGSTNNSPIVSKIPVRRQSAGSSGGGGSAVLSSPLTNGTPKKAIPLPLSRSGSRLAMWSSAN